MLYQLSNNHDSLHEMTSVLVGWIIIMYNVYNYGCFQWESNTIAFTVYVLIYDKRK